jgi:hypothetical protein
LVEVAEDVEAPAAARVSAAGKILDRLFPIASSRSPLGQTDRAAQIAIGYGGRNALAPTHLRLHWRLAATERFPAHSEPECGLILFPLALAQPHSGAATVLVDELDVWRSLIGSATIT